MTKTLRKPVTMLLALCMVFSLAVGACADDIKMCIRDRATPSLSQAQRLKQFSQRGELDAAVMRAIMSEEKKEVERVTLKGDTLRKYFPASYTPKRMEETIIKLLEQWQKQQKRRREAER